VGLERGPFSLVSTIEELLGRNSSGSGLESREYCRRDPSRWPRGTLYPQKLALTSPTRGGRWVGIVRSRTRATEFVPFISEYAVQTYVRSEGSKWLNMIPIFRRNMMLPSSGFTNTQKYEKPP
jgi:hypothetical protein